MMYKQREIVLVPFPYSDLSASKRRPALVISNNNYNNRFAGIIVCVITSNLFKDNFSISLSNDDLESGMLPETSIIKCHKLFTIEQLKIIKRFSKINEQKFNEVVSMLQSLFQNLS
ncbi:MAG: type II toxin-antitoxin system PemK/MazF family toxin [Parafilimonas sp.]